MNVNPKCRTSYKGMQSICLLCQHATCATTPPKPLSASMLMARCRKPAWLKLEVRKVTRRGRLGGSCCEKCVSIQPCAAAFAIRRTWAPTPTGRLHAEGRPGADLQPRDPPQQVHAQVGGHDAVDDALRLRDGQPLPLRMQVDGA